MALLEVSDLRVHFPVRRRSWSGPRLSLRAVDGVDFQIESGETVGLIGESGCGKSTLGRAVLRLLPATTGAIRFAGQDLVPLSRRQLRPLRRQFQMVFQDPFGSLNPRLTVGETIGEALDIHRLSPNRAARRERIEQLLADVGLDALHADRYPHEFSGGQRQRVGIARALAVEPRFLVCDEPVSALDVSVQAQIVNLFQDLQERRGLAYLFVAHDLAIIEHLSRRVLVMYLGRVVEEGIAAEVCRDPAHPYTRALVAAVPRVDPVAARRRVDLPGEPPSPLNPPAGCPFHPRCPVAEARCRSEPPALRNVATGRRVACHLAAPVPGR